MNSINMYKKNRKYIKQKNHELENHCKKSAEIPKTVDLKKCYNAMGLGEDGICTRVHETASVSIKIIVRLS